MPAEINVTVQETNFERIQTDYQKGLNHAQVEQRISAGACNAQQDGLTPTVGKIIRKNVFTLFNFINIFLAVSVILVGHPKNALFLGVAICNTFLGIVQELRAKKTLDKLSVLSKGEAAVIRDGQQINIQPENIVLDDILVIRTGSQVPVDGVVVYSQGLEMNESMLTGESDNIQKNLNDKIYSGSFVSAGVACIRVEAVGEYSYANYLTKQAKKEKKQQTPLMKTLNRIIGVLAIAIIPIGLLLFYKQYTTDYDIASSVLGASAAMIGMIPEGLVLLTGVTLTVGALKLAKHKALVQSLPSIETLARVDVLCLDKTGTITDGSLTFEDLVPMGSNSREDIKKALSEVMAALADDNATAAALRSHFPGGGEWASSETVPFSSQRKWSAASFVNKGSFVLGAPAFVLGENINQYENIITPYAEKGQRVLCLAFTAQPLQGDILPNGLECFAFVALGDNIRPEAIDTFKFFENEGVELKVISGDDPLTVSTIAAKAGIKNSEKYMDMSKIPPNTDLRGIVEEFVVFGRVSPAQKKELIIALKANGHTCCMTGDGVNDVLAMKEASCSVSMLNGSEAARGACDFVLMTNDFSSMVQVLREGRRVINNIENVASLYLVKTIYSFFLSLIYTFIPYPYPFAPLQMTPINSLTVGVPSFFLALRSNYKKPKGKFAVNILENSLPAAITIVISILIAQLAGISFGLSYAEISTMNVLVTGGACFYILIKVSMPLKNLEKVLIGALIIAFLGCFILLGWLFEYESLLNRNAFFYIPLLYLSPGLQRSLNKLVRKGEEFMSGRD